MESHNRFGHFLELGQLGFRIAVSKLGVSDHSQTPLEKLDQYLEIFFRQSPIAHES